MDRRGSLDSHQGTDRWPDEVYKIDSTLTSDMGPNCGARRRCGRYCARLRVQRLHGSQYSHSYETRKVETADARPQVSLFQLLHVCPAGDNGGAAGRLIYC